MARVTFDPTAGLDRTTGVLRAALCLTCVGLGLKGLALGGPILTTLWLDLGLAESVATSTADGISWLLIGSGAVVIVPGSTWSARIAAIGLVMWMVASTLQATSWSMLVPFSSSSRWLLPFALLTIVASSTPPDAARLRKAELLLRIAAAGTFFGHGLSALDLRGEFLDYLFAVHERVLVLDVTQDVAEIQLRLIGAVDITVALLILVTRLETVALWMAFWGIATALVRTVHGGLENYTETLIRVANGGVPLALLLWWRSGRPRRTS